ncbi:alpha-L-arabinofuranosidase [Serinibacter arcticus]|uniref:non-reducing end alpha-L-arabinofuranosidase n=1 Tax=Serinibacter arcticus TaxID=1655435 RepID=A0A2U1ZVK1_9MICO|nr:alpha-N-arabinofuranosidase [Serinibacter arcticus]PWD51008.1 alpha-L-arabinofuranosidase [Serinibacter arcticus]
MTHARLVVDPAFVVGPVRRRTFGSFVEHLGRSVYTGIHDPGHPTADADGFRGDVIELVRELGVSTVRYPGGNFVSGYKWEDGVGPQGERPTRLDLAWHSSEPNTVGLDEFVRWARKADVEPMMAVNLGTRGVAEAIELLEYSNVDGGTQLSEQRRANGSDSPHAISLWCLGNEMDGPWQTGHKTAAEYGRLAAETARAMRQIDPDLELVACGSSASDMPTFGAWEHEVLTETYELVDLISAHIYFAEHDGDLASFLAAGVRMDSFIDSIVATADAVRAAGKHSKRIHISLDEWNVWYQDRAESRPPSGTDWPVAPVLLEDRYTVADAVVVGGLLISLLRHTDRVHAASLAQLVNVIAPIMTEPGGRIWKQTTFHPFAQASALARGVVLHTALEVPTYESARYGTAGFVDSVATWDAESGDLVVFAVNRGIEDAAELAVDLRIEGLELVEATSYAHDDPYWAATVDDDTTVLPRANVTAALDGARVTVTLPPVSWNVLRLRRVV